MKDGTFTVPSVQGFPKTLSARDRCLKEINKKKLTVVRLADMTFFR